MTIWQFLGFFAVQMARALVLSILALVALFGSLALLSFLMVCGLRFVESVL